MSDERKTAGLNLPSVEEFSTLLRTMFINLGFFAATLLLIPSVAGQFMRSAIVIDPIAVPEALAAQGMTPEVVANRLWDGLQDFAETASANRDAIAAIPDSQLIEFSLPDAGISIDSIFAQIRQFFQIYETRIGGEFICTTPECAPEGLQLRLRVVRKTSDIIDLPAMGAQPEQDYFRAAAAGIYEIIDPYVAIAAQAKTAPLKAATLARGLDMRGKDAKWAHNLVGGIELDQGDLPTAIAEFRAAIAIDAGFAEARVGLARALYDSGDHDGAVAQLAELERRAPKNSLIAKTRATFAMAAGDTPEAIRQMLLAAQLDPLEPGHFTAAGKLALEATDAAHGKDTEKGKAYLREALSINPGFGPAINLLAKTEADGGDLEAAVVLYRQWLEFEPDNLSARQQLGYVQHGNKEYAEALKNLQIAYDGGTRGETEQMIVATLFALERYQDVIAWVKPALDADPTLFFETALTGRSLNRLGRRAEALKLYQSYLARLPADDPKRPMLEAAIADIKSSKGAP